MTDLTSLSARVAEMSVAQLAALAPERKHEIDRHLTAAADGLKKARAKLDAALEQSYGDQARAARGESGKDFGVVHVHDGEVRVTVDVPKRVSWDQARLSAIARSIAAAGERIEDYLDVAFSVSESRFNNWPPALRTQFEGARTVKPGKPSYRLASSTANPEN